MWAGIKIYNFLKKIKFLNYIDKHLNIVIMYCENPYSLSFESEFGDLVNQSYVKQSLVLDDEKGELVKSSGKIGTKNGVSETKALAALKSHSEAEKRRRERINAHFATLRGLVPNNEKMDKATLLAEVISQVKQLKKTATQANKGLHIPMDTDEVEIEKLENNGCNGSFLIRAAICCDYKPHLLSDLRQAINGLLHVKVLKCEISTLECRVKTVFVISGNATAEEAMVSCVRRALSNVLDKVAASAEFDQELVFPQKRQRVS